MIPDTALLWAGVRRFEDILKKDPQAYSFAPLAELYLGLGLIDDALQAARKGCSLHPDFAAGQMALARAALEGSLKDEAKKALEAVVRITPENIAAQRLLADIYTADNEPAAAQRCLGIIHSLEPAQPLPEAPMDAVAAAGDDEEIAELDVLELTDDLIEEEAFDDAAASPFAAAPERPSLGDAQRAEPFVLETAPPLYEPEQTATSLPPVSEEPPEAPLDEAPAVVASATIAELYVNQGFLEKGAEIYRQMLQDEPGNPAWEKRLAELENPAATGETPAAVMTAAALPEAAQEAPAEGVAATLHGWLANIGRVRECRTKRA